MIDVTKLKEIAISPDFVNSREREELPLMVNISIAEQLAEIVKELKVLGNASRGY